MLYFILSAIIGFALTMGVLTAYSEIHRDRVLKLNELLYNGASSLISRKFHYNFNEYTMTGIIKTKDTYTYKWLYYVTYQDTKGNNYARELGDFIKKFKQTNDVSNNK